MSQASGDLRTPPGGTPVEELRYALDLTGLDPASLGAALTAAGVEVGRHPGALGRALGELALEHGSIAVRALRRLLGEPPGEAPDDSRFADRAWHENPFLWALQESYQATSAMSRSLLESAELPEQTGRKARFSLGVLLDSLAPTNVPVLNPTVLKEAIDTGGLSLARGLRVFVDDVLHNEGLPRQVDRTSLAVGTDLAATPGTIVYRNDLIELIAYEPRTSEVYATPLVLSPSWINKYYMLDLSPGRSLVEYAVAQGFAVFAISYRNPDASMAGLTMDDYLRDGVLTAIDRTTELTSAERVGLVGVCVGGTMAALAAAVLAARGEAGRLASLTLLNTLLDYGDPGEIGVFIDESTLERIERKTARRGYLEPGELAGPFTWMKGSDLVWRYVISNWYLGQTPPAFDILAWNDDATRLPARMHSQFLRACYLENSIVRPGAFTIDGVGLDLGRVKTPVYVLAAEADHITPWRSSYRTTQLVGGPVAFTLASSGHIAGIVRPPGSARAHYRSSDACPLDPADWLRAVERTEGSWWEHWVAWAESHAGGSGPVHALPGGEPAPGTYVHG